MRNLLLVPLVLAASATAQTVNTTVLQQLGTALGGAGLSSLASLAASIANTTAGNQLLAIITNSTNNFTILAPSNAALGKVPKSVTGEQLATVLSYHVVNAGFQNASFIANSPNNTILQTLLNDTNTVHLQGNSSQVLAATVKGGRISLLNQNPAINVTNSTKFNNFDVLIIDGVLTPPGDVASALKNNGLNTITQALGLANLTDAITNAHGITIFAPSDAALSAATASLGSQATNATLIQTIIQNHIINGTTIYSTQFGQKYTSAAGESLSFNITNNTITVSSGGSGNFTANIITRDVLASNGVVHIIDKVLANTASDASAASSAFNSATSAASNPTTATGPVGSTPAGSPSNTGTGFALAASAYTFLAIIGAVAFGACSL